LGGLLGEHAGVGEIIRPVAGKPVARLKAINVDRAEPTIVGGENATRASNEKEASEEAPWALCSRFHSEEISTEMRKSCQRNFQNGTSGASDMDGTAAKVAESEAGAE
jgi:hypothetical protein